MKGLLRILLPAVLLLVAGARDAYAQFKDEAFTQNYNDDPASKKDSTDVLFSFKDFFGGIAHKHEIKIGTMTAGSMLFPGTAQIYNRDYWKLPIVYAGLGGGIAGGIYFHRQGEERKSGLCYAIAGATYWAMLMDGVVSYDSEKYPLPGRATLYSLLLPGLGQIYNGEAWKIPIYWGALLGSTHFYVLNRTNYKRFRRIYREATSTTTEYTGPISAETALYYRNVYRRYRDYSVLAMVGFYVLQAIDANVFSYMHDFNLSDDLTLSVDPMVIAPDNALAFSPGSSALGVRFGIRF